MSTATSGMNRALAWDGWATGGLQAIAASILLDGLRPSRLEQRRVVRPTVLRSSYFPLNSTSHSDSKP